MAAVPETTPSSKPASTARIAGSSLALGKFEICNAWAHGILNDTAYIWLALKIENYSVDTSFDMDSFIQNWDALKPDSDKTKVLTEASVLTVLGKLAAKEVIELSTQLSLGLM